MKLDLKKVEFPPRFYEFLAAEISPERFLEATSDYPEIQSTIFRGFSLSRKKIKRIASHPKIRRRIQNLAKHSERFLIFLIELWGQQNSDKIEFFRPLNVEFIRSNFHNFKNLLGAPAFFCVLYNLEFENDPGEIWRFDDDFWKDDEEFSLDFLRPLTLAERMSSAGTEPGDDGGERKTGIGEADFRDRSIRKKLEKKLRKQQHIIKSLEEKIDKLNQRHKKDSESLQRYRELVDRYKEKLEKGEEHLEEVLRRERRMIARRLFSSYEDIPDPETLDSINLSLDSTFERVEKALRLQQEADAEYGKISEIRTKLIKIEQYLDEIARIYSDSVFVHGEVRKVKKLLEKEKDRILSLPRAELFLTCRRDDSWEHELVRRLSLLEPTPRSLQRLKSLKNAVENLSEIGLDVNTDRLYSVLRKKETAIVTYLSEKFCAECDPEGKMEIVKDFDEFIKKKTSKDYDLYVDAYNILLSANGNNPIPEAVFSKLRDRFTKAVVSMGNRFNRVFLVYDGVSSDKEKYSNVEVFFADRLRGESADEIIIRLLNRRKDSNAVLATADREIIARTKQKVFATIEPYSFFSCLYDYGFIMFPPSVSDDLDL